ncbi:MAG: hypothetical protein QOH48_2286 [Actinomycetota bacterium]|nr:hypothetical protein [Actinomycetota bacterium]
MVALLGLGFGRLVVDALAGRREIDSLTRWALAFPGLVFFSFVLMLLHLASGGRVFSDVLLTRGLTVVSAVLLAGLRWWRRPTASGERLLGWQSGVVLAACALGIVVWGAPVARVMPLNFTPDTNLHMGWASQLMIGESSPSTVVTGHVPGYYPWLYHALVALLARFSPGGRAFDALGPIQLLQVVGAILGLFAAGRFMTGKFTTGAAAAFFGALCGGFGAGMLFDHRLQRRAVNMRATKIPWLGDVLSRRPYNFAFNDIAPAYPRDLSFSLLVGFLLLLFMGLRRQSYAYLAAAGVVLGLVGLSGGEAVIVGAAVALVVSLLQRKMRPLRAGAAILLPMTVVYGTWLVPLIVNYIHYGGFVNTTHVGPVVLTFPFLILSWGLATPFAIIGLTTNLRSWREPGVLVALAIVVVTAIIMGSNVIPQAFGSAFLTLGRDHRYWALCQLGAALLAALGATAVLQRIRSSVLAAGLAIVVVFLGIISPAFGSAIYPQKDPANPLIAASLEGRPTLLNAMAPAPDRRCVAAVPGNALAREVFAYTGYRLVQWVTAKGRHNWARIRWHDIYRYIPGDIERAADNQLLTLGLGSRARWRSLAQRYGLNLVVVPQARAASPVFAGYPQQRFTVAGHPFTLVRVKPC